MNQNGRELTPLGLLSALLRYRRTFLVCVGVPLLAAAAWVFVPKVSYTSEALIMPTTRKLPSGLSSIASQFGVAVPADDPGQSPAFYADLLTSREVLGSAVDSRYETRNGSTVSLLQLYGDDAEGAAARREEAMERLRSDIVATPQNRTGTVRLEVSARDPVLAFGVTNRLLELASEFNLETRQSQAAQERRFTEQRLAAVRGDLAAAEEALQRFDQRNLQFRGSAALSLQRDRLEREVSRQQQLYNSLSEAYEQSRIEEVRNTPLFTVVERPFVPVRHDSRRAGVKLMLGLFVGLTFALTTIVLREAFRRPDASERAELLAAWGTARQELRRPWRLLRPPQAVAATDGAHSDEA